MIWFTGLLLAGIALVLAGVVAAGLSMAAPRRREVGPPPADLAAEPVEIPSPSGALLRGWFVPGQPGGGAVLLLHGVWNNRLTMLRRAALLKEAGCASLLVDFQAQGESSGRRITFGQLESLDARAALAFLRQRLPGERLAAIGVSLGGAAALLGPAPLAVDALVLESVFSDIRLALANRLRVTLGPLGPRLLPLFARLLPPILGVDIAALRPIERIGGLPMPLLIAAGTADDRTTLAETRALFARADEPKRLWIVEGAGHVDLERYAPADYRRIVLPFLTRHLRRG